jgi:hypothetical protein
VPASRAVIEEQVMRMLYPARYPAPESRVPGMTLPGALVVGSVASVVVLKVKVSV